MKILVSWLALNNDFKDGQAVKDGPTYGFHQNFYDHDQHIILYAAQKDKTRVDHLENLLKRNFKERNIQFECLNIIDVIDVREIKTRVETYLLKLKDHELDIFVSPGTPAMQVSWYLCHMNLGLKTTLYQTRAAQFTKDKKPELIRIEVDTSTFTATAILHQEVVNEASEQTEYKITPAIKPVYADAQKIAQTDNVTTLILGESGTGKEHLASYIHKQSVRSGKLYLTLNCSALGDQLLESRLFGYKKGAFTGADKDTKGLFQEADGGTIFLDEIGDISPYMQQALLRVLQEKEVMPIGGKADKVDVRIITATNRNLPKLCEEGKFRWDLYYRLAVVELQLPSLIERGKEDLREMIDFFISKKKQQLRKSKKLSITKTAMDHLLKYSYPGNLRELENIIARLYVYHDGKIEAEHLPKSLIDASETHPLLWKHVEKEHIKRVLKLNDKNQKRTAEMIGYSINTLKTKLKMYKLY